MYIKSERYGSKKTGKIVVCCAKFSQNQRKLKSTGRQKVLTARKTRLDLEFSEQCSNKQRN